MNRYRIASDCSKAEMLQILAKASSVINFCDVDDKIHIYPFDSVNYITID